MCRFICHTWHSRTLPRTPCRPLGAALPLFQRELSSEAVRWVGVVVLSSERSAERSEAKRGRWSRSEWSGERSEARAEWSEVMAVRDISSILWA